MSTRTRKELVISSDIQRRGMRVNSRERSEWRRKGEEREKETKRKDRERERPMLFKEINANLSLLQ